MKKRLFIALVAILSCYYVQAQTKFKHKRITVFKDGTSFIEKTITIPSSNKTISFKSLPVSLTDKSGAQFFNRTQADDRVVLGSLRFTAKNNSLLQSIVNRYQIDSSISKRGYASLTELINLNIGKKVKIFHENDSKPVVTVIDKAAGNVVIVRANNNFKLIPLNQITKLEFVDKPATEKRVVNYKPKQLVSVELKLLKDANNQQINMSYLQKGITWLPTYFIDLYEQKKGKLTLEANLLNDIEDIKNTEINFAVGVPSFAFKYVNEPLVSKKSVWEILKQLNKQQIQEFSQGIQMNMMTQSTSYNSRANSDEYTPQVEGVGGEDLYFYKKQNIGLNKFGRMKVQLISMNFNYDDVYSCELEQNVASRNYNPKSKANVVWHSIRFKNNSKQPFTTGTVFFKKEKNEQIALVSQNQLDYTPENEYVTAKMTVAPDILISSKDIETDRKEINNDYLLNINGEINIANYKSFPVDLIIKRKIIGTMLDSDKEWKVSSNLETYNAKNKTNQVKWNLKIAAGKSVKIQYKYKILVD